MNLLGLVLLVAHAVSDPSVYRDLPDPSADNQTLRILFTDDQGSNVKEWCKYHPHEKDPYWCLYASYSVGAMETK